MQNDNFFCTFFLIYKGNLALSKANHPLLSSYLSPQGALQLHVCNFLCVSALDELISLNPEKSQ